MAFDPFRYLPKNYQPTAERIEALVAFHDEFRRAPTEQEVLDLLGAGVEFGTYTDPLPDGYAGEWWNNPRWLREGTEYDRPVDPPYSDWLLTANGQMFLTPDSAYLILVEA